MTDISSRFHFASAPDSWGVLDYPGPSWNQSYEKMLDEMVAAGYTGSELGPYGFFPTDPAVLKPQLAGGRGGLGRKAVLSQQGGARQVRGVRHEATSSTAGRGGCRSSSGSAGQPGAQVMSARWPSSVTR